MNKYILPLTLTLMIVGGVYLSQHNILGDIGIKRELSKTTNTKPQFSQFNEVSAKILETPSEPKKTIEKKMTADKAVKADRATYSLSFAEGSKLTDTDYFEQMSAYLGYNTKDKKVNDLKFSPDLSYNSIITGDNSQVDANLKWGLTCDDNNNCAIQTTPAGSPMYHGVPLESARIGKANLYFNKDLKFKDLSGFSAPDVYFVKNTNSTWPLAQTGVIGMGPDSEYLKYVVDSYSLNNKDTLQFSFFYDVMSKDNRYTADKKDAFAVTMNWFGQNKDNLQKQSNSVDLPTQTAGDDFWSVDASQLQINGTDIIATVGKDN